MLHVVASSAVLVQCVASNTAKGLCAPTIDMDERKSWRSSVGIIHKGHSWGSMDKDFTPTPPSGRSGNPA